MGILDVYSSLEWREEGGEDSNSDAESKVEETDVTVRGRAKRSEPKVKRKINPFSSQSNNNVSHIFVPFSLVVTHTHRGGGIADRWRCGFLKMGIYFSGELCGIWWWNDGSTTKRTRFRKMETYFSYFILDRDGTGSWSGSLTLVHTEDSSLGRAIFGGDSKRLGHSL